MQIIDKAKGAFSSAMAWAKSIPSEPNGIGSSSRIVALTVTITLMGIMGAFYHSHHDLPTPGQLYGISAILATGLGGYVANKLHGDGDGDHSDHGDGHDDHPQGDDNGSH